MSEIKRYMLHIDPDLEDGADMLEDNADGYWCKWDDVAALTKERDEANNHRDLYMELCSDACKRLIDTEAERNTLRARCEELEKELETWKSVDRSGTLSFQCGNAAGRREAYEECADIARQIYQEHREQNAYYNLAVSDVFNAIKAKMDTQTP